MAPRPNVPPQLGDGLLLGGRVCMVHGKEKTAEEGAVTDCHMGVPVVALSLSAEAFAMQL